MLAAQIPRRHIVTFEFMRCSDADCASKATFQQFTSSTRTATTFVCDARCGGSARLGDFTMLSADAVLTLSSDCIVEQSRAQAYRKWRFAIANFASDAVARHAECAVGCNDAGHR